MIRHFILFSFLLSSTTAVSEVIGFEAPHAPDQLIVKFRAGTSAKSQAAMIGAYGAITIDHLRASGARVVVIPQKSLNDTSLLQIAKLWSSNPDVVYVEANVYIAPAAIPNDSSFSQLYALENTGQRNGTPGADIDAINAWDITTGSPLIKIGLVDTGMDYRHPDLAPNAWKNPGETGADSKGRDRATNGLDDDSNGLVDDYRGWDFFDNDNDPMDEYSDDNYLMGHGTHCAGILAAKGNNNIGVAGVAWDAQIVPIKIFGKMGTVTTLSIATKGIEYATRLGVHVTSNSYGWNSGSFSPTMLASIQEASEHNIPFVAGAGNGSRDSDRSPFTPAAYRVANVISVGATDNKDTRVGISNFGVRSVHVSAPGGDIYSTQIGNRYKSLTGTSMATPFVAGVVALLKVAHPELSVTQIKERIMFGSNYKTALQGLNVVGGRLNAFKSLETDNNAPGYASDFTVEKIDLHGVTLKWKNAGDDGDSGLARSYDARWATQAIKSEDQWEQAASVPAQIRFNESMEQVTATIGELPVNSAGFVAVRAIDNVGNRGPINSPIPVTTPSVQILGQFLGDSMSGLQAEGQWGIESLPDRGGVYSDSPNASNTPNINWSLTLPRMPRNAEKSIFLAYATKFDTDRPFGKGVVEVSKDGTIWKSVQTHSGGDGWIHLVSDITSAIGDASQFTVRFRIETTQSNQDGWLIDDIQVYAK